MSILSKFKSYLPPSSRSFHAMYSEMGKMHGELGETHYHLGQMWGEVGHTRIMVSDILCKSLPHLEHEIDRIETRFMLMLWELYRKDGESLADAKRRLTTNLDPSSGTMRLYQMASAQLLFEFDAFCAKHGIRYWLVSGTLLGAVRHKGFIPWDDDLDVGMTRDDIERAIAAVKDDDRYEITVRYDYCVHCRQVRFRFADETVPCFIDLFYFDPVSSFGKETFVAREAERASLEADLVADEALGAFWSEESQFVDDDSEEGLVLRNHFDEHVQALYERGLLCRSIEDGEGIIWGIDNVNSGVSHHTWYMIPKEAILPIGTLSFEGHEVNVPADYMRCLEDIFGNIYDVPHTVGSYFNHSVDEALNNSETHAALERLAEESSR